MPKVERRTQADRRSATRAALLRATIDCLVELGYTRTTTTEVTRRAGLSQGALFKHFATKGELVAAATTQLFDDLIEEFDRAFAAAAADEDPVVVAIRRLWKVFCAPELGAVYRLYTEAPFDEELAAALVPVMERHEARVTERATALFPEIGTSPQANALFAGLVYAMQGMTLPRRVRANRERERLVLGEFERVARVLLPPKKPSPRGASDA